MIIGGGPAGTSAAVYAARKKLRTVFLTSELGGQSTVSSDIQNWIGSPHISGDDLAKSFESHIHEYKSDVLDIQKGVYIEKIEKEGDFFSAYTPDGKSFKAKSVLIATGSKRRKLEAENADHFEHKGLTYCASCDGLLFQGQNVAVLGGGNSAFESAAQLLAYCPKVYLIHRNNTFKADEITIESLKKNPHLEIITNAKVTKINGNVFVEGLSYIDNEGIEKELAVSGIFVEIGQLPNTEFVKDLVKLDERNKIVIDPWTGKTSTKGVWAAGDCTNILYHQNNIASGEAVKALEDIYITLKTT